jgi:hypothetical protein
LPKKETVPSFGVSRVPPHPAGLPPGAAELPYQEIVKNKAGDRAEETGKPPVSASYPATAGRQTQRGTTPGRIVEIDAIGHSVKERRALANLKKL